MKRIIQKLRIAILAVVCTVTMFGMRMEAEAGPADNSLQYIKVTEGSLSPAFEGSRLNYTVHVGTDTASIEVSAKTSNPNAAILSGTGTYSLTKEETKAPILVEAENGTQVTYTVTIIKDGVNQPADTDEPADITDNAADGPDDTVQDSQMNTGVAGYGIADKPENAEIPIGFSETTAVYQDKEYTAYKFDNGNVTLFYMENEAKDGAFFVYNEELGHMYPFIRVDAGEHKLILMEAHAYDSLYPGDPAAMPIGSQVFEAAYQREPGNEYQFYAMDETGAEGWYQYNVADETFATFSMSYEVEETENEDNEYLQKAYNDLNDKFNTRKDRDIKIIAGLIVLVVILIFVIINLLLRGGKTIDDDEEGENDIFEEEESRKQSKRRFGRRTEEEVTEDITDLAGVTETADTDIAAAVDNIVAREAEEVTAADSKDDDIEVMDLNDL